MTIATLGDIADWGSGGTPKRGVADYFGDGVPWLSIADLNDGVVYGAKESLTSAGLANSSAKIVPEGTIFVAMYGSIGKLGVAGSEMCTSQAIAFAKPHPNTVDSRFLFHYLLNQRPALQALGRGGTQMNIGQADLKAWPIPLPPLPEQRRIATILDHADALRVKRRQVLAHLDTLTQSIFHNMFSGDPDVAQDFGELCERLTVGVVVKPASHYVDSGVTALRTLNVKAGRIDLTDIVYFSESSNDGPLRKSKLRSGDLVIARTGKPGTAAVVPPSLDGANAIDLIVATPDLSRALPIYLESLLNSTLGKQIVSGQARGQIQQHFNVGSLKAAKVPVPPLKKQREFADRINSIVKPRVSAEKLAVSHDLLFTSLQSHAFRGDL